MLFPGFDGEANSGALLGLDVDINKRRDADNMHAFVCQIPFGDYDGFDRLINSSGTDSLHLCMLRFPHNAGDGPGDCCGS